MRRCDICHRPILLGQPWAAMQVFAMHPLCALRFIDRTPEQEHDVFLVERLRARDC